MQTITLKRGPSAVTGTPGLLTVNGTTFHTLELGWYNNIQDYSCIPPSSYQCNPYHWDKFNLDVFELQNVPDRVACLIHMGNWAGDTRQTDPTTGNPYRSDVEGCIILGLTAGVIEGQLGIGESVIALKQFMGMMGSEPFMLEIVNG